MLARAFPANDPLLEFANDVTLGLTQEKQRELPSKYLYDELGSVLFEAITLLPEYGLTRADERVIRRSAPEIGRYFGGALIAELGSGSGKKTRHILNACLKGPSLTYAPIDLSPAALAACAGQLGNGAIEVHPIATSYLDGIGRAAALRQRKQKLLVLFLGSTIGNFDRNGAVEFLRKIGGCLLPGDGLLLGTDLEKPIPEMLVAYDDPTGVTAAFNLNLLGRINRELGGDFDLRMFQHEARYDVEHRRIEMHLRSRADQTVTIPGAQLRVSFVCGETIWTEASHKFALAELPRMAAEAGFVHQQHWIDEEWPFAESLWMRAAGP
ncbi:MAG TPA: L-histidine N(alpha)-methyltransferase [Bryobacteraceae bacterium]|nr:L-histidine N(alpha)-methyltransferase [Bryobacteraceae bacterium]